MAAEMLEGSTECRLLWFWSYHGLRLAEQSNWQVIGLVLVLRHSIENHSNKPNLSSLSPVIITY